MNDDMSGNDREPAAWVAFDFDGGSSAVYLTDAEAQAAAEAWGWKVAPLFFGPTLTDAERAVIEAILVDPDSAPGDSAATLRGLLERTAEK